MANKAQLTESLQKKVAEIVEENVAQEHFVSATEAELIDGALSDSIAQNAVQEIDGQADEEDDSEVEEDEDDLDDEEEEEDEEEVEEASV
jgi:hypothetical protein